MEDEQEDLLERQTEPGIGDRLRMARESAELTLAQVAAETRISQRHLQMIEAGDFAGLPGRTYALGFSRSFARVVGLDEDEAAAAVRAALDEMEPGRPRHPTGAFEPGDPARVPSARLGWFAAAAAVLLLAGVFSFYRGFLVPGVTPPPLQVEKPVGQSPAFRISGGTPAPAPSQAKPDPRGRVVFTAMEEGIWVKFYDADGKQLMQKQMAMGERYAVPPDARGPRIWTGRPDALAITVGGRDIPKLAEKNMVVKDVSVTAKALLSRPREAAPQDLDGSPTG